MLAGIALLSFGLPFTLPLFVVSAVVIAVGGIVVALRRRAKRPPSSARRVAARGLRQARALDRGRCACRLHAPGAGRRVELGGRRPGEVGRVVDLDTKGAAARELRHAAGGVRHGARVHRSARRAIRSSCRCSSRCTSARPAASTTEGTQAHLWIVLLAFGWALAFLAFRNLARPAAAVVRDRRRGFHPGRVAAAVDGLRRRAHGAAPHARRAAARALAGEPRGAAARPVGDPPGRVREREGRRAHGGRRRARRGHGHRCDRAGARCAPAGGTGARGFVALLAPWQIHLATSGVEGEIDLAVV